MTEQNEIPKDFNAFGLSQILVKSLQDCNFANPTDIQSMVIPTAISGSDILASSKTGSGKTLAFCIPVLNRAIISKTDACLILVPTREIATQVSKVVFGLIKGSGVRMALLIGGEMMSKQKSQLKGNPQILIGTPGRVNDYIDRKLIRLENVKTMVLDEADRMLDMGFDVQIREIFKFVDKNCQKLMFSATIPKKIEKLANEYLVNPEIITNVVHEELSESVKDVVQTCKKAGGFDEKIKILLEEMDGKSCTTIIFANTKSVVEKISDAIDEEGFSCEFIHGDLKQSVRAKIIEKYRAMKYQVLVATDVLARGLDVDHIEYVVNFDMPANFDEYIHRIGRTNRHKGSKGEILNLVGQKDFPVFREICDKLKNINADGIDFPRSGGGSRGGFRGRGQRTGFRNRDNGGYHSRERRERDFNSEDRGERKSWGDGRGERRERREPRERNFEGGNRSSSRSGGYSKSSSYKPRANRDY